MESSIRSLLEVLEEGSEKEKVKAAISLSNIAASDRLACAFVGAFPVVSGVYQESTAGSDLEASCMAVLSQFLTQDQTTPFFVGCLLNAVNAAGSPDQRLLPKEDQSKEEDEKLVNCVGALFVLAQRIYDPSPATLDAILRSLPGFINILRAPGFVSTKCNIARMIGAFADYEENKFRVRLAKSGVVYLLHEIFQNAEADSELEHTCQSCLNRCIMKTYEESTRKTALIRELVEGAGAATEESEREAILSSLAVFTNKMYLPDDIVFSSLLSSLSVLYNLPVAFPKISESSLLFLLKILTDFSDAPADFHLELLKSNYMGVLNSVRQTSIFRTSAKLQQAAEIFSSSVVTNFSPEKKDGFMVQILSVWNIASSVEEEQLLTVSLLVFDVASKKNAGHHIVHKILPKILQVLRQGGPQGQLSAVCMMHKLCAVDTTTRDAVISLDGPAALISALLDGSSSLRERIAAVLVLLSLCKDGAQHIYGSYKQLLDLANTDESSKLSFLIAKVLSCLPFMVEYECVNYMLKHDALLSFLKFVAAKDDESSVMASLALSVLVGADELAWEAWGDAAAKARVLHLTMNALHAVAGLRSDLHDVSFLPLMPVTATLHLSRNDLLKKEIITAKGLPSIEHLLKTNNDPLVSETAARVLWNLAFKEDVEKELPSITQTLHDVKSTHLHHDGARQACDGTLFQIAFYRSKEGSAKMVSFSRFSEEKKSKGLSMKHGNLASVSEEPQPPLLPRRRRGSTDNALEQNGRIVLSCHRHYQSFALWLKKALTKQGYAVWTHVERPDSAQSLDDFAKAVDEGGLILMCYSKRYKNDEMCRSEAEYAKRAQKLIFGLKVDLEFSASGWLEALLNARPEYDFGAAANNSKTLAVLLGDLELRHIPKLLDAAGPPPLTYANLKTDGTLAEDNADLPHGSTSANKPSATGLKEPIGHPDHALTAVNMAYQGERHEFPVRNSEYNQIPDLDLSSNETGGLSSSTNGVLSVKYSKVQKDRDLAVGDVAELHRRLESMERKLDFLLEKSNEKQKGCCTVM